MLQVIALLLLSAALAFAQYIPAGSGGGGSSGSGISYCAPASASGTTYTCTPSPAVSSYAAGTTLAFVPDVNGTGGATTVNVNALGAKSIKLADGSTNPASTDLVASVFYLLTYDGTVFRVGPQALVTVKTLYSSVSAKQISGSPAAAFQCISNCPSPSVISSGSAATAELLVTTNTSNQTSQDQFVISQIGYSNQPITIEIVWRTSDTNVAHTATVTPTFVCVAAGDVANPTFASAGGAITLTPPGNTNRTVTTNTFTPSGCATGREAFWLLSYNTTSGGSGAITNLGILSVRLYASL